MEPIKTVFNVPDLTPFNWFSFVCAAGAVVVALIGNYYAALIILATAYVVAFGVLLASQEWLRLMHRNFNLVQDELVALKKTLMAPPPPPPPPPLPPVAEAVLQKLKS